VSQGESLYGDRIETSFRLDHPPSLITRSLTQSEIAVTECRSNAPDFELSEPFPEDDAYIVALQLRAYPDCESWETDRCAAKTDIVVGETHLYDIKRSPQFVMDRPFHMLGFYIPRSAFDLISEEANGRRLGELDYRPGYGFDDETVRSLGIAMRGALARPEQASRLFVDHVTYALTAHVAKAYGGLRPRDRAVRGGLAGWRLKRVCDRLEANLDGGTPLQEIADECGLSVGHFSRAFRQSTGLAPHAWLLRRRVEVAQDLMRQTSLPLERVATLSGFADQSHFTRTFSRLTGISPGAWRRHMTGRSMRA
jgi:AraC family transcriptional regulator